jgi:hypothetical protein
MVITPLKVIPVVAGVITIPVKFPPPAAKVNAVEA